MTESRMVVRVEFSLEINATAWESEYGIEGREAIRADVREYVENGIRDHLAELGLLA